MRTIQTFLLLWTTALASPAWSQVERFPYEAVVQGDSVHIRSGPGLRNYATGKLKYGDRVMVHRHDPGGWYMIAPPASSFSWIDASLVEKTGATTGIVRTPAFVRVGSALSEDCSVLSRELESGDEVTIIGEKMLKVDRGPVLMYQIKPPAQEFRWVKGDFIVPAGAVEREQHDLDPFAVPAAQKHPSVTVEAFADPGPTDAAHLGARAETPADEPIAPLSNDLEVLDRQLTEMLAQDPTTWRLDEFEHQFQALLPKSDPVNAALIRQRLSSIAARKQAHANYLDFVRLTTETTLREQQLRTMQQGGLPAQPVAYPQVQLGLPQPILDGSPTPASLRGPNGAATPGLSPRIEPIPDQPLPGATGGPVMPKFDGAGIVQRSGNPLGTVPPYVLISPTGRLLAFLEPGPGMNLEPYVGQQMGVVGQRGFDARLQTDRIVVRRLQRVQLQP